MLDSVILCNKHMTHVVTSWRVYHLRSINKLHIVRHFEPYISCNLKLTNLCTWGIYN